MQNVYTAQLRNALQCKQTPNALQCASNNSEKENNTMWESKCAVILMLSVFPVLHLFPYIALIIKEGKQCFVYQLVF